MTNLNALLALGAAKGTDPVMLVLGTVTAVGVTTLTVLIDGAETGVTAIKGTHAAAVDDRVIVTRIGRSLYVLLNLNR